MSEPVKTDLEKEILEKAKEEKISCAECMKIAEKLDYTLGDVGKTADNLGIKIVACQLGCF